MQLPAIDFGGTGEKLIFLHANGYPPDCYRPLITHLTTQYHVTAMVQRPLWPDSKPDDIQDWRPLTEDFLRFLGAHQIGPVVCVGHSMGGITLLQAALWKPECFKAIVLLDPVLFPPYFITFWSLMRALKLGQRFHPLVVGTRRRLRRFDDLQELYDRYRRKSVFRYLDDQSLRAYVEGIACRNDGDGYQLCYSVDWEIQIYLTSIWRDMDIWRKLPELKIPTLIVRGAETNTFWEHTGWLVKRKQPTIRVETLEKSTHLVPLEKPSEVSYLIQSFLEEYHD